MAEKLGLLLEVRAQERVTWSDKHRPAIDDRGVYPRAQQQPLPVWIAVGGTPASAVRAGTLGLPMVIAIIGGEPERFKSFADLYREAARRAGQVTSPGHSQRAAGSTALPALNRQISASDTTTPSRTTVNTGLAAPETALRSERQTIAVRIREM